MKKYTILLVSIFITGFCNAQVGINTDPAAGKLLHIKNTAKNKDLLIVDSITGKVGIGTTDPQSNLHVIGNMKSSNTGIAVETPHLHATGDILITGKSALGDGLHSNIVKLEISTASRNSNAFKLENIPFASNRDTLFLISDSAGNAKLDNLRPRVTTNIGFVEGKLSQDTTLIISNPITDGFVNVTLDSLVLTKGKWLIIAKLPVRRQYYDTSNNGGMLMRMRLYERGSNEGFTTNTSTYVNEVGLVNGTRSFRTGYPEIIHIVHIKETKIYSVWFHYNVPTPTSPSAKVTIYKPFGKVPNSTATTFSRVFPAQFYALRLDDR